MTPQLILTLSPSGSLQAELPSSNGGRRVVPLQGTPSQIIESLERILHGQLAGQTRIGETGAPTAYQARHHQIAAALGCPFCNLGLQHSQAQCGNAAKPRQSRTRRLSPATVAIVAAHEPPIDPTSLGF